MAARDRFGAFADLGLSPVQRAVRQACDISHYEPNLALNLEVADLINSKKGNAPREAAFEIVYLINSRNQNVSLLALALLDICVKNCGYPFQLQVSTKEFLNELVRRFPERPPMRPSRVQHRILESIEEWRQTICQTSRYKEDLGHIRDMHRLLLYKGYMFPEIRHEDAAVLNPSDNLRSAEEMEEEEREAQSAKLQELIRRGTPMDLQEANRLMKVMAGYDNRHKTDYRAKAAEEVAKVQQKAKILEEMLQSVSPGERIAEGDVFEELASALQSAHPKIQKMCEEESDDPEAVQKLLEINDSIHRTIERYTLIKTGDVDAASRIPKGTLGTTTGVSKNANNELSLIDMDPEPADDRAGGSQSGAAQEGNSLQDDLLGLSMDEPVPSGGISLGPTNPPISQPANFPATSTPPQQAPAGFQPNYDILSSLSSSRPQSQVSTSVPGFSQPPQPPQPSQPPQPPQPTRQQQQQQQITTAPSSVTADPFAALVSASSRGPSPFAAATNRASTPAAIGENRVQAPTDDDEWNFTSSLPDSSALPSSNKVVVLDSSLRIEFVARRHPSQPRQIHIVGMFSNRSSQQIMGIHFQVAVSKAYRLQLRPQSGRVIPPLQENGVQQEMLVDGVEPGQGDSVKIRFRVSYNVGGQNKEEQGVVPALGIS